MIYVERKEGDIGGGDTRGRGIGRGQRRERII